MLADKIIELRKKAGYSQEDLANKLGVSRQAVSKWESNQATPEVDKLAKLALVFNVSVDYLISDEVSTSSTLVNKKSFFDNKENINIITSIYWAVILIVYFLWSFLGNSWGISWIVWVIAGFLYTIFIGVIKLIKNNK